MATAKKPTDGITIPKQLVTLFKEIRASYRSELEALANQKGEEQDEAPSESKNTSKNIRQLMRSGGSQFATTRPSSTKLDVIRGWQELFESLVEKLVFLEYAHSMEEAFREIAETPAPVDESAMVWFRHQFNLVKLLTHTVQNHFRDDCTECRFVTILEVTLSYQKSVTKNEGQNKVVYQWKPSNDVKRFWVRLMQPIDPNMAPFDFRRKAYGVLVSLSWVPASKGLLEACSIADSRSFKVSIGTPVEAQRLLQKIPRRPLSRNDCVYQVLDRLKDETNVSVVISSSKYNTVTSSGIGKSTVVALVASHSLILKSFKVLWLNLDYKRKAVVTSSSNERTKTRLDYVQYIQYLDSLCDQLDSKSTSAINRPQWPEVHSLKRLEEPAIRYRREENMMRRAQQLMADMLDSLNINILLILDDLSEDSELEWFQFVEKQSLLATSQATIHTADFVVELDPWGEEESKELFLLEANINESHVMVSSMELSQIVANCHYHPVIVRTAARLFMLKKVTTGLIDALEEANMELADRLDEEQKSNKVPDSFGNGSQQIEDKTVLQGAMNSRTPRALAMILDASLSPQLVKTKKTSVLFKLCFASMAAVFGETPQVPLTAVLLLWEQLFTMEPDAIKECGRGLSDTELRKHVWFVAEGLTHIGLLSFTEDEDGNALVAIHHEMYKQYALELVDRMDLGTLEGTRFQWHKAFVAAYLTRKFEGSNVNSCHTYALKHLPQHMLCCKLYVKAVALLSNERLYEERIAAFGRDIATKLHVRDCVQLMQRIRLDPSIPRDQRDQIADYHFQKVATLITENVDTTKEGSALRLAKDLYSIGFSCAECGKFVEALALYTQAQNLVPHGNSFAATVLYGLGHVNLILNDHGKATKSFMAAIACMKILGEDGEGTKPRHLLYLEVCRLQATALMAQCSYGMALSHFEETLEVMKDDTFESKLEYGMLMYWKGRLHSVMGDAATAASELEKSIKWKETMKECSRNLAAAHSALADIYANMGRPLDARKQVDAALKTIEEVDAKWPVMKYDDDDKDPNIEVKLLTAKLRSLRPDLPQDFASYEYIREAIKEYPVLLMDQSAYDLRSIARAYTAAEEHDRAVSVLEDALNLMAGRTFSLERALCLIDLGNSFMDQGENYEDEKRAKAMFELALKLFELALNIQRPKLGDCVQVLETLDAIGNLNVQLRDHETAISVYTEALALAKKLRSDKEKIAGILYFLGECYEELGQHDNAENRYKECLMGLRSDRTADDLDLARPLQRLGAISLVDAKYEDAKQLYEEILKIREANFDADDVLLAETRDVLAFIEMKHGNYEGARRYLKEALEIRKGGDNLRAVSDTLYQIGITYRMQKDSQLGVALKYFEESLGSMNQSIRKDDPLLANVVLAIANTRINLGKTEEAAKLCQRALDLRITNLGPDHRKTANAARSLGITKYFLNELEAASFHLQEFIRITDFHPSHRKSNEYLIALIMLSDIQEASGKPKISRKILLSAKDVYKTDPGVAVKFPNLKQLVDKRLSGYKPALQEQDGKFVLDHDADELGIFRSSILSDD